MRLLLIASTVLRTAAALCTYGYDPRLRYIVQMLAVTDDARALLTAPVMRSACDFLQGSGLFQCRASWSDGIAGYRLSTEAIVPQVRTFVGTEYTNVTYIVGIDSPVEPPAGIQSAEVISSTDCNTQGNGGDVLIMSRRLTHAPVYGIGQTAYVFDDGRAHSKNVADIISRQGLTTVQVAVYLEGQGVAWVSNVIAAIDSIVDNINPGDVVLMTTPARAMHSTDILESYIFRLIRAGALVITAAGNLGSDACDFVPARMPEVITVGASSWPASNHGRCVDMWANGTSVTAGGSTYTGTAQAAATIAGWASKYIRSQGMWSRKGFMQWASQGPPLYG